MIAELGNFALVLAFAIAIAQTILPLVGAHIGSRRMMMQASFTAAGVFTFVVLAYACHIANFVASDFTVLNVANNSSTLTPTIYKITATWGSHEGSLLLWVLMIVSWTFAVVVASRALPESLRARVIGVLGFITAGFLLFMLATSNPFDRLIPSPTQGRDLNPLLQDPGMIIHPPFLYMGYVGFAVAFAFAIAGLIEGKFDATWARWTRPWTTAAWSFLSIGICLGSAWAYYELGWGGWWFWDPVENASLMPWLAGAALIHSLAVTEKRGAFKSWTILLAIVAFSLSLLGTFLVRSGVLTSVHAFATDPKRGVFILIFLLVVIGGSLALYAFRAGNIGLGGRFMPVSRETMLLANNVLFSVALAAVLLGTLYPLALDALGKEKISIGAPYFNAVFYPLMAPAIFLMGIGPLARWKHAPVPEMLQRLKWALISAVIAAIAIPLMMGKFSMLAALGFLLATFVIVSAIMQLAARFKMHPGASLLTKLKANSFSYYGMMIAHAGMGVLVFGVTMVNTFEQKQELNMKPGQSAEVAGFRFVFNEIGQKPGTNFSSTYASFTATKVGEPAGGWSLEMKPEKRTYTISGQTMTEAAIKSSLFRDVYVSIGEPLPNGEWLVGLFVKPFVNWMWIGCLMMALGGFLCVADKRYRVGKKVAEINQPKLKNQSNPANKAPNVTVA